MNLTPFVLPFVLAGITFLVVIPTAGRADPPDFNTPVCFQPAVTDLKIVNDRWPDASSPRQFALDAIRLENAKTDQEKAIALWLWIRRFTMYTNGIAPAERGPKGPIPVNDPVKILNVWGAHWCDGLSRCMELSWRHLGYRAQKFYKSGHTLCDAWWVDDDGVGRYHLFDVSEGWFAFTRDGKRIANAEDLARDASLVYRPAVGPALRTHSLSSIYGWVHATHFPYVQRHKMELTLRPGETLQRCWVNVGKPFQDNIGRKGDNVPEEHGPWKPDYGNGCWRFEPSLTAVDAEVQCYQRPINCTFTLRKEYIASTQPYLPRGTVTQTDSSRPAVLVYRILSPYIISGLRVWASRQARVELSDNKGQTWLRFDGIAPFDKDWLGPYVFDLGTVKEDRRAISAFGRYDVLVRISLDSGELENLGFVTNVQHNIFSLPQLMPGENKITVEGSLAPNGVMQIDYFWRDSSGKRANLVDVRKLPYTFSIHVDARSWKEVLCAEQRVQTCDFDGRIHGTWGRQSYELMGYKQAPQSQTNNKTLEPLPSYLVSLGKSAVPLLKSLDAYLATLTNPTTQPGDKDALPDALAGIRVLAFNARRNVAQPPPAVIPPAASRPDTAEGGCATPDAFADGKVYDAVRQVALTNLDRPKYQALQVMYWLDHKPAVADFLKVIREEEPAIQYLKNATLDPNKIDIVTDDRDPGGVRRGQFYNVVAVLSRFLADEKCVEAVPTLIKLADEQAKTRDEPRRALLRSLGELGDKAAVPVLIKYAGNDVDDAEIAVEALGRCGDPAAIPAIRKHVTSDYSPLAANAIRALAALNDRDSAAAFRKCLTSADEDIRGAAAEALALLRDTTALEALGKQYEVEPVAWTKQAIGEAMHRLKEKK